MTLTQESICDIQSMQSVEAVNSLPPMRQLRGVPPCPYPRSGHTIERVVAGYVAATFVGLLVAKLETQLMER